MPPKNIKRHTGWDAIWSCSCRRLSSAKEGLFTGGWLGAVDASSPELQKNKGPCFFPLRSTHYETVRGRPTSERNSLTSDGSERRGRERGPNLRRQTPSASPASTSPESVSLGHGCVLFVFRLHPRAPDPTYGTSGKDNRLRTRS